jgi:6-phospho-beta-glucosidase
MRIGVAERLKVAPERVELHYVGLNHLSWARVLLDGCDITSQVLDSMASDEYTYVAPDFLRALGMIPNYYLRYYVHPDLVLRDQLRAEETRAEYLMQVERELLEMYTDPTLAEKPALLETRGGAHYSTAAVNLLRAIATDRHEVQIVNVRNEQSISDLPASAIVEVPAVIAKSGAHPLVMGSLPPAIRGLVVAVKAYEQLTVEAAITGDDDTARMALLAHPLVPSWDTATALWQDIKSAHRQYLPQFV